jgi:hypothetical protein
MGSRSHAHARPRQSHSGRAEKNSRVPQIGHVEPASNLLAGRTGPATSEGLLVLRTFHRQFDRPPPSYLGCAPTPLVVGPDVHYEGQPAGQTKKENKHETSKLNCLGKLTGDLDGRGGGSLICVGRSPKSRALITICGTTLLDALIDIGAGTLPFSGQFSWGEHRII